MKDTWNKKMTGNSEEGFYDDDIMKKDDGGMDARRYESHEEDMTGKGDGKLFLALAALIGMICISIILYISADNADQNRPDQTGAESGNGYVTSSTMEETETKIGSKPETGVENKEAPTGQNEETVKADSDTTGNTDGRSDAGWEQIIFGQAAGQSIPRMISVKGITDEMVGEQGFLQTAFVKAAGSFLSANGIRASSISFVKPVAISSKDAYGYKADMIGAEGYSMIVIWYRSYPGKYILSIIQKDEQGTDTDNNRTGQETRRIANETTGSETQTQPSSDNPGQNVQSGNQQQNAQNVTLQVQSAPEATQANPALPPNRQSAYDATALSIRSIPEPLLNYISNRYDFQYSLYDFLYRNGHRGVTKATVTDYAIDGDRRMALIEINLDDGSQISATYDHDANAFSFTG